MSQSNKDILVIIPARLGSKRLPGKNYKALNGKPLIAYSIEFALNHISNADVVISTNDPNIVAIADSYPVSVDHRLSALSTDDTPTSAVLQHLVQTSAQRYKYVVLLQPTNPLRPQNLFKQCYEQLISKGGESLICLSPNDRKLGTIDNGIFKPSSYHFGQRSQDLSPLFYENGLMYISSFELVKKGILFCEQPLAMVLDHPFASVDIDTELDFKWAEFVLNNYDD